MPKYYSLASGLWLAGYFVGIVFESVISASLECRKSIYWPFPWQSWTLIPLRPEYGVHIIMHVDTANSSVACKHYLMEKACRLKKQPQHNFHNLYNKFHRFKMPPNTIPFHEKSSLVGGPPSDIPRSQCSKTNGHIIHPSGSDPLRDSDAHRLEISAIMYTLWEKFHRALLPSGRILLKLLNTSCIGRSRVPVSSFFLRSLFSSRTALRANILSATLPTVSWYCSNLCTPSANWSSWNSKPDCNAFNRSVAWFLRSSADFEEISASMAACSGSRREASICEGLSSRVFSGNNGGSDGGGLARIFHWSRSSRSLQVRSAPI